MLEVAGVVCPTAGILVVVKDTTPAMGNAVQCLPAVEAFAELFLRPKWGAQVEGHSFRKSPTHVHKQLWDADPYETGEVDGVGAVVAAAAGAEANVVVVVIIIVVVCILGVDTVDEDQESKDSLMSAPPPPSPRLLDRPHFR